MNEPAGARSQLAPKEYGKRERTVRVVRTAGILLLIGLAYALFVGTTGIYLPCPIRTATGYLCPGCGVSHLAMALLAGDLRGAYAANPFLFFLLPVLAGYLIFCAVRYIRTGENKETRAERIARWALIPAAVLFGILRNVM